MPNAKTAPTRSTPLFWSVDTSSPDGLRLTYAVRGGARHLALLLFGIAVLAGGLYALYWLVTGGDLTAAGYVFLLVPCGVVLFGVYVLDIALLARTTFVAYHDSTTGKPDDFALDGLKTPEEAAWLGPLLAKCGEVRLQRGFGAAFDEADPAELPEI